MSLTEDYDLAVRRRGATSPGDHETSEMMFDLRQFLYIDLDRSRSILSQLGGAEPWPVAPRPPDPPARSGVDARPVPPAPGDWPRRVARSLQEGVFSEAEAMLAKLDLLLDLDEHEGIRDPELWAEGAIHDKLSAGQIVRLTADITLLDAQLVSERMARLERLLSGMVVLRGDDFDTKNPRASEIAVERAVEGVTGMRPSALRGMVDVVAGLTGEELVARALPCGLDDPEYHFSGVLGALDSSLLEERSVLFGRYGSQLGRWTIVMQLESVTAPAPVSRPAPGQMRIARRGEAPERSEFESLMLKFSALMDGIGLTEGPAWPAVTMTPLAIYRAVPPAP